MTSTGHDSLGVRATFDVGGRTYAYYSLAKAGEKLGDCGRLPFSMKVLLENLLRFEDGKTVTRDDIQALVDWQKERSSTREIQYRPARVLMQDFTGVPAVVDLAAMRDAMRRLGGDPQKINPLVPVHLVIDHSVMVDAFGTPQAFEQNVALEYERNFERYRFLKWGQSAFANFEVVPPGTGICHQVNLEYIARGIWSSPEVGGDDRRDDDRRRSDAAVPFDRRSGDERREGDRRATAREPVEIAYPDTLVGTDSHTTMVNGLGVLGWGVGGIEAEAAMLGQPVSMLIPRVVGFKLSGEMLAGTSKQGIAVFHAQHTRTDLFPFAANWKIESLTPAQVLRLELSILPTDDLNFRTSFEQKRPIGPALSFEQFLAQMSEEEQQEWQRLLATANENFKKLPAEALQPQAVPPPPPPSR